jgi:hypothetical protein
MAAGVLAAATVARTGGPGRNGGSRGTFGRTVNPAAASLVIQITSTQPDGTVRTMLRADELTVVHHDDTVSRFTDVMYCLDRHGLRLVTTGGDEKAFPGHDVLTTLARLSHPH